MSFGYVVPPLVGLMFRGPTALPHTLDKDFDVPYNSSCGEIQEVSLRNFMATAKALADGGRVRILAALDGQELCVCELIELLELAPSTVSKHLSMLKQARLVECRRNGRWSYYRVAGDDAPAEVRAAMEWVRSSLSDDPVVRKDGERISRIIADRDDACAD